MLRRLLWTGIGRLSARAALALLVACACFAAPERAAATSLFEVNNGLDVYPDQPGDPLNFVSGNVTSLELEPGINEFEGFFTCFGFGCRDNFDSFVIVVPTGLEVISTSLLVENNDGTAEQLFVFDVGGFALPADQMDDAWKTGFRIGLTDYLAINNGPAISTTVLGAGVYEVVPHNYLTIGGGGWHAEFLVGAASAPEPAIGGLILVALAGLAARRTRA